MARTPTSEPRARLFVALDLADDSRAALVAWRAAALDGRDELRLPPPESLHMTLVFLGGRTEAQIAPILDAALEAPQGLSQPALSPARVVAVPRRRPRLLALDLLDEKAAAAAVHSSVSTALAERELHEPERRPFWPHVTLARVRGRARLAGDAAVRVPPLHDTLRFDRVTLFRSHLSPHGAHYEALASRELAALG